MKPHRTLRSMLVHPKDKLLPHQKSEAIYEIPCADCPKSYIGETGRSFGTRLQEHQKEVVKFELKPYKRSSRKSSVAEQHKSAITDHVVLTNHNIKWDAASHWLWIWQDQKMGQGGHLDSQKRKEHSKQRRGGIQIEQHLWSTFPHHALNGSFQQLQKDDVEWTRLPVWRSC